MGNDTGSNEDLWLGLLGIGLCLLVVVFTKWAGG